MSNTFHPGVTRHMAEKLVTEGLTWNTTGYCKELYEVEQSNIAAVERALNRHACSAAGICGNDPSSIYRSIWYRSDGWGHGGSAITWQDRAEELEAELVAKNALLDRAAKELDDVLRDAEALNESTVRRITKLLTDIEHL